jgi:hypothetical protein
MADAGTRNGQSGLVSKGDLSRNFSLAAAKAQSYPSKFQVLLRGRFLQPHNVPVHRTGVSLGRSLFAQI